MPLYEHVFLARQDVSQQQVEALTKEYSDVITEGGGKDVPIPGSKYGFAVVVAAQARGDFAVLAERQRRLLRVHIGGDVRVGLLELERAIAAALR